MAVLSLLGVAIVAFLSAVAPPIVGADALPPTDARDRNLTVVRSPANRDVTVSYKRPNGTCNTAFDSQRQYTGWVSVPTKGYPTNLFFWFVEAREKTDSLTIWLNGGPGSSSLYGFFTGNGPCEIVEEGLNRYETVAREWGWDRASNMLFIDQPNQVGFSYDAPTNGTLIFPNDTIIRDAFNRDNYSYPDWAFSEGTFSSGNSNQTANTTETAALAVWHMVQGFLTTFPQYQPSAQARGGSIGINLFAESYGGQYGPVFAETFEEQNSRRRLGVLPRNTTIEVHLKSLGIVNGCVDMRIQTPKYPLFANQNSYNVKALGNEQAAFYSAKFDGPGGCRELLDQCSNIASVADRENDGTNTMVNDICSKARNACVEIQNSYLASGKSPYDIGASAADPFPPMAFLDYLNQPDVLYQIGAPINFTMNSPAVFSEFSETGDQARGGHIPRLAALLNKGVRVGMVYGDRDYICNWLGGEAVAFEIAKQTSEEYNTRFGQAGYAPIIVNDSYIGGAVRQFGNLSFSRIYQAGHAIPAYQPETSFQVFARIIMGTSLSTGKSVDLSSYGSNGSANATQKDSLPNQPKPTCYVRAFQSTCDSDSNKAMNKGEGVVINGILYSASEDWPLATETPTATKKAEKTSSTLTGLFTATTTPPAKKNAAGRSFGAPGIGALVVISFGFLQALLG